MDFADVRGQEAVKRALTVALCGGHSVLLFGPSGWGKTMLAERARAFKDIFIVEVRPPKDRQSFEIPESWAACDIHVEVPAVPFGELTGKRKGTDTDYVKKAIKGCASHTDLTLSDSCLMLLKAAMCELGLNARSYHKMLHVARTIANMDGSAKIAEFHLAEAIQYRLMDRTY